MIRRWWNRSSAAGCGRDQAAVQQRKVGVGGDAPEVVRRIAGKQAHVHGLRLAEILLRLTSVVRPLPRRLVPVLCLMLMLSASTARAATISLGWMSFSQYLPPDDVSPGTNAFDISNATGPFALPDPTVLSAEDPLSFLNADLLLYLDDGSTVDRPLGEIDPGMLDNFLFNLQFDATTPFTQAVFTATLSSTTFVLSDGSTFTASSPDLVYALGTSALLLSADPPSAIDFQLTGDVTSVPEPGTLMLLAAGLGTAVFGRRRT